MSRSILAVLAWSLFIASVSALNAVNVSYTQFSYVGGDVEWLEGAGADQLTCPHRYTAYPNVSFSYTFEGVAMDLYLSEAQNTGNVQLIFDGQAQTPIDTRASSFNCAVNLFNVNNLTNTQHTINGSLIYAPGDYFNLNYLVYYTLDASESASLASSTTIPTGSATSTGDPGQQGSSTNVGAIAGGVVAGVAVIALAGLLFFLWKRKKARQEHSPIDLIEASHTPAPTPWVAPASSNSQNAQQSRNGFGGASQEPLMTQHNYSGQEFNPYTAAGNRSPPTTASESNSDPSSGSRTNRPSGKAGTAPTASSPSEPQQNVDLQHLASMVAGIVMNQMNTGAGGNQGQQVQNQDSEAPPMYTPAQDQPRRKQ